MNYLIYPIYNGSFTVGMGNTDFFPDVKNIPSYAFLIVQSNTGKAVLIDTGFSQSYIPGVGSTSVRTENNHMDTALAKLGFKAQDIETVVMTHLHWDHTGSLASFSHARIYVQAEELRSLIHLPVREECSFCPSHWLPCLKQLELLEGSSEILPGLKVLFTGGHTAGHQVIEVDTAQGKIILGGDAPFNYSLMWTRIPDQFWQLYYSGPGKHCNWDNNVRRQLKSFLMGKNALTRQSSARMRLHEVRNIGQMFFTSHDPGLSSFSCGQSIAAK